MGARKIGRKVEAEHGVVASFPEDFFGYFGWPTVARLEDGRLAVAASGLRNDHVCPFGRSVLCTSADEGRSWTSPRVINDSPLDDRDTGLLYTGGKRLLLSWFSTDNRATSSKRYERMSDRERVERWRQALARVTDAAASRWAGAWVRRSEDGGETWSQPLRVPLSAPHGPIRLQTGALLFVGKHFASMDNIVRGVGAVAAMRSHDEGRSWELAGSVPLCPGTSETNYHEPHAVELKDGRLLALIRVEDAPGARLEGRQMPNFSMVQTFSGDRGHTWSEPEPLGFHGSPPHLLRHSSGALVCVYGYRQEPFGQRAMISRDEGDTWECDWVLRDDGPDADLGYPSSVELQDGCLLTVYYQKPRSPLDKCSLLWTRWYLE